MLPARTCHSGRSLYVCWCKVLLSPKGMQAVISQTGPRPQLHVTCPALSRMQDNPSVYRPRSRRKEDERLPANANGIPMVAIFFLFFSKILLATRLRVPACPGDTGHADAAGCNLALRRLRARELGRHKRLPRSLRKAGNVMDYKLLQSPRNRPGPSLQLRSRFPFVGDSHVNTIIHDVWRKNVSPSGRRTEQMSLVASHILQVIKHAFLSLYASF